jgi:signal transduction histidine kinase
MLSVRPADLLQSSAFRFAVALTAVFVAAYTCAGLVAFQAISADLDEQVAEAVELTAEAFADRYRSDGKEGLVAAVTAHAVRVEPDDELIWLGDGAGEVLAGRPLLDGMSLATGDATGAALAADEHDRYRLAVRDLGDLRLVVARSYEDSDDIRESVLGAFAWATLLILLIAGVSGLLLAVRGQKRIKAITSTLQAVSHGEMTARVPASDSGDDLDRLSLSINDALSQLETTVDGIRQVTNDIAHDLRTPLTRLGISLERAQEDADGAVVRTQLEAASAEVRRLTGTFDALLSIAQIEAGAGKSRFTTVELHEIATSLHETYQPIAGEREQSLLLDWMPKTEALVHGDRELLTQLYANLIENAIRHCPPCSSIRIAAESGAEGVWMGVEDDGPGIPEHVREKALQRFYRLEKARNTPGTGLGLALVKAIADLHGAVLTLSDNAPGLSVGLMFPRAPNPTVVDRE